MYFTEEDYRKIEDWLKKRVVKDSELAYADIMSGDEKVALVQDGHNRTITINDLLRQMIEMKLPDFYNVTDNLKMPYITLEKAVINIPVKQRKLGLVVTFLDKDSKWGIYQFKGESLNQWSSLYYWKNIIYEAIEEAVYRPDEEDLTGVEDGNRLYIKFKDREYNPEEFSGLGMVILRKNLKGTEACSIDDEDHFVNILTQDMISKENTVYIIQYDFDLNGKTISIPRNCVLWFKGGSLNNGSININEAAILGAFEFADMGNVELFGKFNIGQVMTFVNDKYSKKQESYFIPFDRASSTTIEEDAKRDSERVYIANPNAYKYTTRQELRWWNGEEWLLLLDITDYEEIKSVINDIIIKHNAEMSECYKYFKKRIYALEVRVNNAEATINDHETRITKNEEDIENINTDINNINTDINNINNSINVIEGNIIDINNRIDNIDNSITTINSNITDIESSIIEIKETIENIDTTITNSIKNYIDNNILGVKTITINDTKYSMDDEGNITLPDYPETKTLDIKSNDGTSLGTYDGSEDTVITLPEFPTKVDEASKVTGILTVEKSDGTVLGTYNGSEDKTITLPESSVAPSSNEVLTIKQGSTTLGTYDGSSAVTVSIPESSSTDIPSKVASAEVADKVAKKLIFTGNVEAEYDGSEEVSVDISNKILTFRSGGLNINQEPSEYEYNGTKVRGAGFIGLRADILSSSGDSEKMLETAEYAEIIGKDGLVSGNIGNSPIILPLYRGINGGPKDAVILFSGTISREGVSSSNNAPWTIKEGSVTTIKPFISSIKFNTIDNNTTVRCKIKLVNYLDIYISQVIVQNNRYLTNIPRSIFNFRTEEVSYNENTDEYIFDIKGHGIHGQASLSIEDTIFDTSFGIKDLNILIVGYLIKSTNHESIVTIDGRYENLLK